MQPDLEPFDDTSCFLEKLGAHQAAAIIASQDYNCSLDSAAHMLWLSEPNGQCEFPLDLEEDEYCRLEDLAEDGTEDGTEDGADVVQPQSKIHTYTPVPTGIIPGKVRIKEVKPIVEVPIPTSPVTRMTRSRAARITADNGVNNALHRKVPRALLGVS